jgi:hypothetical protein
VRGLVRPRLPDLAHHGDVVAFHFHLLLEKHQLHLDAVEVLQHLGICHRAPGLQHRLAQDFGIGVDGHLAPAPTSVVRVWGPLYRVVVTHHHKPVATHEKLRRRHL